jgi:NAD(P)-dependent dehydrogenase (short-subunit alcohol dehydrogenase family)
MPESAFRENAVIPTGASSGIGRALALAARNAAQLEAVAAECRSRGAKAIEEGK